MGVFVCVVCACVNQAGVSNALGAYKLKYLLFLNVIYLL